MTSWIQLPFPLLSALREAMHVAKVYLFKDFHSLAHISFQLLGLYTNNPGTN
jgi:hypothetical protein